ncbi:hypothetical protein ACFOYU_16290 [Microvirga sp. GCM10011540]|uniref:hypothetical protein n=1 Tax=Microvirga sp. GCM10011540 TaxID=3317338 RepID=UPI003623640F
MRRETRGWVMLKADMLSMLRLINEKMRSRVIDARHQDVLVRLREILENDLSGLRLNRSASEREGEREKAG